MQAGLTVVTGSDSTERREATIYGDYCTSDERGRGRQQPEQSTEQILRSAEAAHRCVLDDSPAPRRQLVAYLVRQQEAVLFSQKEAWREGIHTNVR